MLYPSVGVLKLTADRDAETGHSHYVKLMLPISMVEAEQRSVTVVREIVPLPCYKTHLCKRHMVSVPWGRCRRHSHGYRPVCTFDSFDSPVTIFLEIWWSSGDNKLYRAKPEEWLESYESTLGWISRQRDRNSDREKATERSHFTQAKKERQHILRQRNSP